jgi:hypothetical protein
MPPPKKVHDGGSYQDQPKPPLTRTDKEVFAVVQDRMDRAAAGLPYGDLRPTGDLVLAVLEQAELCRFTSIGCLFRLRKLPAQPMLPERIILERRVSHLHEKEEWDTEWRQQ